MKIYKLSIDITGIIKKLSKLMIMCFIMAGSASCDDYLDVIPDDMANIDHLFANKKQAERYLATLYSYAPNVHRWEARSLTFLGGDDLWTYETDGNPAKSPAFRIAKGEQNVSSPHANYWDGCAEASMYTAIRDCNIFIEEMNKPERVPELSMSDRKRWIAEAKFLKAYYHFLLFRMYGPIPIVDKNLSVGESIDNVAVKRNTVDEVVNYISNLLDEAIGTESNSGSPSSDVGLPLLIENEIEEYGRVTIGIAYMLKARLWATAASPLFNGNPDYKGFADNDGVLLFPQEYDASKWTKAMEACEDALDNLPGTELYTFTEVVGLSDRTQSQMNLRGAVTMPLNKEIIWGRYWRSYDNLVFQAESSVPQMINGTPNAFQSSTFSVTMNMVERFYSKNGVPIDEDKTWDYANRYAIKTIDNDQKYNLIVGYQTAIQNQDRENRFYASLMFDGCVVYMNNSIAAGGEDAAHQIRTLAQDNSGIQNPQRATVTGYWLRKIINWKYAHSSSGASSETYPYPEMRLADLKLLYAEALNEVGRSSDAIKQVDDVRARSGLKGVVESWNNYSNKPSKPGSQDGLRDIIHQEREIELAFEGHRLWDLKRWKKSVDFLNKDIRGWNVKGETSSQFYQVSKVYEQTFIAPRDYLWPISLNALLRNPNLVQNPGWN